MRALERLTDRQGARVAATLAADPTGQLHTAWVATEGIGDSYQQRNPSHRRSVLADWPNDCSVGELARPATTLDRWRSEVPELLRQRLTNGRPRAGT